MPARAPEVADVAYFGTPGREAGRFGARFVIIVGEEELESGQVTLRDMGAGEQSRIYLSELESWLKKKLNN